jgi:hypothetical protein
VYVFGALPWLQRTTFGRGTSAHSTVIAVERPPSPPLKEIVRPLVVASTLRVADAPRL